MSDVDSKFPTLLAKNIKPMTFWSERDDYYRKVFHYTIKTQSGEHDVKVRYDGEDYTIYLDGVQKYKSIESTRPNFQDFYSELEKMAIGIG